MKQYLNLIFWGVVWLIIWIILYPFIKNKDNCATWAIRQWTNHGGYLSIRWCRSNRVNWIKWPHFLWLPEEHHDKLYHVIPENADHDLHWFPAPVFKVKLLYGDDPNDNYKEN